MRGWLILLGAGLGAGVLAWLFVLVVLKALKGRRYEAHLAEAKQNYQRSLAALFAIIAMYVALPLTGLPRKQLGPLRHLLLILLIVAVAWSLMKLLRVVEEALIHRYPVQELAKNPRARRLRTQIQIIRRLVASLLAVLALAFVLMTFAPVRVVGQSLLASAGLASIVFGIAAQGTLSHVLAGIQIAFTDALRVDDVVVLEGEWGHVENVQLTHVIVRSWDERRLVLPTTYFTTKPYQNWTRYESRVIGTIELQLDYTADIDNVRAETGRLLETNENWDHQYWVLETTETTPQGVTIRIAVSAPDGARVWWLRCQLREALIKYLRDQHPQWLPRTRSAYQP
ncbi:mechanosensitive ion channel domain-containing protein [Micromonospora sp. NPDC049679]|uniref:mechanosensitive ion channel family protein n=1 Tax=Micromonospora sp. NPDC049679 TaxID=3155920 RepID=UPI0033EC1461